MTHSRSREQTAAQSTMRGSCSRDIILLASTHLLEDQTVGRGWAKLE